MTTSTNRPTIILLAYHWLGAWAWDEVLEHLGSHDSRATALTLPGLDPDDPDRAARTLDDQAAAILDAMARLGVSEDQPHGPRRPQWCKRTCQPRPGPTP